MKRRDFLKYLATSGLLATSGGALSTLLAGCNNEKGFDIEDRYNFLDHIDRARISSTAEQYVKKAPITVNGETREVLFTPPETKVVFFGVPVHRDAHLSFGVAIHDEAWKKNCNGVLFEIVLIDASDREHVVYSRYVDPMKNTDERRWIEEDIDLSEYRGQTVAFRFKTSVGPYRLTGHEWSGWSGLELFSQRNVRPDRASL